MYKYLKLFSFLFLLFSSFSVFPLDTSITGTSKEICNNLSTPLSYCTGPYYNSGQGGNCSGVWYNNAVNQTYPACDKPCLNQGETWDNSTFTCKSPSTMFNCPDGVTTVDNLSKCSNSVACLDGTTVFSPATCPNNSWSFWAIVPTTPTVCPTGETICACEPYWTSSTCGDLQFKKYFIDWKDKNKELATLAGFALGTTRIVNPALLFQGEKLLMDGKLITNGGNTFKVTTLQAEVPGAVRNSALIEYMGKNPNSSLTTNFISAASSTYG